jgi:hypothetical protein
MSGVNFPGKLQRSLKASGWRCFPVEIIVWSDAEIIIMLAHPIT